MVCAHYRRWQESAPSGRKIGTLETIHVIYPDPKRAFDLEDERVLIGIRARNRLIYPQHGITKD